MKKQIWISLFLSAALLAGSVAQPVAALSPDMLQTVAATEPAASGETSSQEMEIGISGSELPFGQASILEGCRTMDGLKPLAGSERRFPTSQGVFAYEANTGTVIYSYNPDVKLSPGTLAKIVLALVAIENCELDEVVTCVPGIQSKIPAGSTSVKLKSEEQLTVEDLLHCILLQYANDAAVALAEHVAGTTNAYVEMMNQRVKKMGCMNTQFGNISGLDTAVSYSTARDMARIFAEACENETFVRISGTVEYTVPETNMEKERKLKTVNYMIDNSVIPQFLDNYVKAGMTSHTEGSGSSMVNMSEYNGMKLICVVLGAMRTYNAEQTWRVESYGNYEEMQSLMEFLYSGFKVRQVLYDGQALSQFSVIDGESDVVGEVRINYPTVLPVDCSMDNLYMEYKAVRDYIAPIHKGEMIATVAIKYRNSYIAEAELYAMNPVVHVDESEVSVRSTAVKAENTMDGIKGFLGAVVVLFAGAFGLYLIYNTYRRARRRVQHRRRRASRRRSY